MCFIFIQMLLLFLLPVLSYASITNYFHTFVDTMDSTADVISADFVHILSSMDEYIENHGINACFKTTCLGTDCKKVNYPITVEDRVYATISKGVYLKNVPEHISAIGNVVKYRNGVARVNQTYEYSLVETAALLGNDLSPEWAIYSEKNAPENIIVGFRGTFHSRDVDTDLDIGRGKLDSSDRFNRNFQVIQQKIQGANSIVFTGHSLGGALAVETLKKVYHSMNAKAVIFNAGYSCKNNVNASLPVRSWRTDGDMISFMGIGKYNEEFLVSNHYLRLVHVSRNPLDRHSMNIFTQCPEHYKPEEPLNIPFCIRGYSIYETGANHWLVPFFLILGTFGICYCCMAKKKTHYNYYGGLENYNNNFGEMDRKVIIF